MTPQVDHHDGGLLGIETVSDDGRVVVTLTGEADVATVPQLHEALARVEVGSGGSVRVQVADLDFVDSAALHQLIAFASSARDAGSTVTTSGARPIIRKLAQLLCVDDQLGLG